MAHDLTVNTTRTNLSASLVSGLMQPYSPAQFPQLSFGEEVQANLYLTDGDAYDTRSGLAGYSPRIAITLADQTPKSGTFTISDGTEITSELDWDATATEIETALNALNSNTGPFGDFVTVTKYTNGAFLIVFDSVSDRSLLTVNAGGLLPICAGSVVPIVEGSPTIREQQMIQIKAEPLVFSDGGAEITNGWLMTLNANNANFLQAVAKGDISANFTIDVVSPTSTIDRVATGPVILKQSETDILALSGIEYPDIPTLDGPYVNERLDITGLDGGTITDLNYLATVDLDTNYTVLTGVEVGPTVPGKTWTLKAGTDANDPAGGVVRPLDFNATTNAKVWKATQ